MNWKEVQLPSSFFAEVRRTGQEIGRDTRCYECGDLRVLTSYEQNRWHLSISHPHRNPRWKEIKEARYDLLPDDTTMAQLLPPKAQYVNLHPHTFHLWEIQPMTRENLP